MLKRVIFLWGVNYSAVKVVGTCPFIFLLHVEHNGAHIYRHREGFDGAAGRSQRRDGVWMFLQQFVQMGLFTLCGFLCEPKLQTYHSIEPWGPEYVLPYWTWHWERCMKTVEWIRRIRQECAYNGHIILIQHTTRFNVMAPLGKGLLFIDCLVEGLC